MRTKAEAESQGFNVDITGPGRPWGDRGRIPNLERVPVLTDLEEALVEQLRVALTVLKGPATPDMVSTISESISSVLAMVDKGKA